MSDMWNTVTIQNPGAITLNTLPEAFSGDGAMWEDIERDDVRVTIPRREVPGGFYPERPGDPSGNIEISGGSKYRADDLVEAIVELSKANSEAKITHGEYWSGEQPNETITVYVAGEILHAESQHTYLLPFDLMEKAQAADAEIRRMEKLNPEATRELAKATRALLKSLGVKS